MINSILVVCMGNICRSPVAERLLANVLPDTIIHSAGLIAQQGMPADTAMANLAQENGITLIDHSSQRFTVPLANQHDLILVMERKHLATINQTCPQISGKSLLFSYWAGREDIPDPYKKNNEYYGVIYQKLMECAKQWKKALRS